MALMFPSLFRPPVQGRCSLLLMGVGLGEDSCPKVLDRSRLSPGSEGVEPLTDSRTKEELSSARHNYIALGCVLLNPVSAASDAAATASREGIFRARSSQITIPSS